MMKKVRICFLLLVVFLMTGCGEDKLKCTSSSDNSDSLLEIWFRDGNQVYDMRLTTEFYITGDATTKQAMMEQARQKTSQVFSTDKGFKAIFDMNSGYFDNFGLSKTATSDELKQMLELEGYVCK